MEDHNKNVVGNAKPDSLADLSTGLAFFMNLMADPKAMAEYRGQIEMVRVAKAEADKSAAALKAAQREHDVYLNNLSEREADNAKRQADLDRRETEAMEAEATFARIDQLVAEFLAL